MITYDLQDVKKSYVRGSVRVIALNGVSLKIHAGEAVAIGGRSGSGKSTLMHLLGGLDHPTSGVVVHSNKELRTLGERELSRRRAKCFGFVFQSFFLLPTLTARENIEAAMIPLGTSPIPRRNRAIELLGQVGLADRADHLPGQLSGGEQQRVAIARAMANDPEVVLADEPTGNLDRRTGSEVLDLLQDATAAADRTLIVVTHDQTVSERFDRSITLADGIVVGDQRRSMRSSY